MKLQFYPSTQKHHDYTISGSVINGIDLSEIQGGESFSLPEMQELGIIQAERDNTGELYVTLQQACTAYRVPVNSHDWAESDWIDAAQYDPGTCYIKPTNAPDNTTTAFIDTTETLPNGNTRQAQGWTVVAQQEAEA